MESARFRTPNSRPSSSRQSEHVSIWGRDFTPPFFIAHFIDGELDMKRTLLLGLILLVGSPAWSQDLDRLVERANLYWSELSKGDKVKAAQYVDAASRKEAIMYDGVKEPRVESLSLTGDKSKVLVSIRTKMFLPEVQQEVRQTLTETWIFANGNWFMKPEGGSPFTGNSDSKPTAKTVPFTFELLDRKIDLGRHQQGEMVKGSLRFKAPRDPVENIRGRGIPGFRVTGTQWTDDSSGVVNFVVDTTLLADD